MKNSGAIPVEVRRARPRERVRVVETGEVYDSVDDAAAQRDVSKNCIRKSCFNGQSHRGVRYVYVRRRRRRTLKNKETVRRAWCQRAVELGWPAGTTPRELQVLHALYVNGPMSLPEIGAVWGVDHRRQQSTYACVLGRLIRRGLLLNLGYSRFPGTTCGRAIYSLPLHVGPRADVSEAEVKQHAG